MARLAGMDLPAKKRTEIGSHLHLWNRRTRSKSLCYRAGVNPDKKVADLTEDEVNRIRQILEAEGSVEGDSAQRTLDEHQALDRDGLLPGFAPPARAAGAGATHAYQCADAERSAARHRGQ